MTLGAVPAIGCIGWLSVSRKNEPSWRVEARDSLREVIRKKVQWCTAVIRGRQFVRCQPPCEQSLAHNEWSLIREERVNQAAKSLDLESPRSPMPTENQSPFSVRHATVDDVNHLDAFIEPFVRLGRLLPRTRDELEDLTENGFLAEVDGRIVGFAALEIYSTKLAELRSLAVSSEFQGQGVGKALVQACVELARQKHVFEVMAITSSDEFFQRCGFDFTLPGEKKAVFLQTRESY